MARYEGKVTEQALTGTNSEFGRGHDHRPGKAAAVHRPRMPQ